MNSKVRDLVRIETKDILAFDDFNQVLRFISIGGIGIYEQYSQRNPDYGYSL
jgi:hypothetical protein